MWARNPSLPTPRGLHGAAVHTRTRRCTRHGFLSKPSENEAPLNSTRRSASRAHASSSAPPRRSCRARCRSARAALRFMLSWTALNLCWKPSRSSTNLRRSVSFNCTAREGASNTDEVWFKGQRAHVKAQTRTTCSERRRRTMGDASSHCLARCCSLDISASSSLIRCSWPAAM